MTDWAALAWSCDAAGDALSALAAASGLASSADAALLGDADEHAAIERTAEALGLDALPVTLSYHELESSVARLAPALVRLAPAPAADGGEGPRGYLAVISATPRRLIVLTPQLRRCELAAAELVSQLARALTAQPASVIETWFEQARVSARRRRRARPALLAMLLAERTIAGIWVIRRDPGCEFRSLLAAHGVRRHAREFLIAAALQLACTMASWSLLGHAVLNAELAPGWLWAFLLLIASGVPLQAWTVWSGGRAGLGFSALIKQRLLCGALRLDPARIRAQGSGGLLAMVSESEALERAGLDGTFSVFVAIVQLAGAAAVLAVGASGLLHTTLLLGWTCVLAALGWHTTRRLARWTDARFDLSKRFVEQVQGHRTRLAQGLPERWHEAEDRALAHYADAACELDRTGDWLAIVPGRGWLCLAIVALVPCMLQDAEPAALALTLGGMLQAQQAFTTLSHSLGSLLTAAVAWRSVRPLFEAARALPMPARAPGLQPSAAAPTALELRGLSFRHAQAERPTLCDCNWRVRAGERWLLDGPSGSGKSSLAGLITGIYPPSAGMILLDGLDRVSMGSSEWQRRVASAPQFHENHLLTAPLSFNLLMGRAWPPNDDDVRAAHETCRALGLGPLLARMPSGIHQLVGETGWQLSHGEQSRVFLARALLQRASLVLLDESFGALDPDTLQSCMEVARARAPTLLVIAHP
jgi:ATP-binding cassette subfamily B protein